MVKENSPTSLDNWKNTLRLRSAILLDGMPESRKARPFTRLSKVPALLMSIAFYLQNATFSKWAMLESNQRPPPCKGGKARCRVLHGIAVFPYLSRFLFPGLPCIAPYCAPGGVRVVSKLVRHVRLRLQHGCSTRISA